MTPLESNAYRKIYFYKPTTPAGVEQIPNLLTFDYNKTSIVFFNPLILFLNAVKGCISICNILFNDT